MRSMLWDEGSKGKIQRPAVVTIAMVVGKASSELRTCLEDSRYRRQVPHRFEACDYVPVRNIDVKDGKWVINGKRHIVYGQKDISPSARIKAAQALQAEAHPRTTDPF